MEIGGKANQILQSFLLQVLRYCSLLLIGAKTVLILDTQLRPSDNIDYNLDVNTSINAAEARPTSKTTKRKQMFDMYTCCGHSLVDCL